jgi:hypothetical protein
MSWPGSVACYVPLALTLCPCSHPCLNAAVAPGKELRWRGSLPIPGLFVGEHYFVLEPSAAGKTHLIHGENFKGLLVPMVGGMLKATEVGFSEMNSALKKRVEAAAAK